MLDVFEDFLKSSWQAFSASIVDSNPIYTFLSRLKALKEAIIPWVKKMKFEQRGDLVEIEEQIVDLFLLAPTGSYQLKKRFP